MLTSTVGDQPTLLVYLGLLTVARDADIATAHAYITDSAALDDALENATDTHLLHLARLKAGLSPDSAPDHLTHGLAAAAICAHSEAAWAAGHSHDTSASWERTPLIARAKAFGTEHPDVDITAVLKTLAEGSSPAPDDAHSGE